MSGVPLAVRLARLSATLEELRLTVAHGPQEALPGLVVKAQEQTKQITEEL